MGGIAIVALAIVTVLLYLRYWNASISSARKFERQLQKSLADYAMSLREDEIVPRKPSTADHITTWGPRLVFSPETVPSKWHEAWCLYREEALRRRLVSADKPR